MLVTLGLAALLPAACGCGGSNASTSSGVPGPATARVDAREEAHALVGPDPLVGGYESIDALGRAVVDALSTGDRVAAWAIVVDVHEWKTRLFPALVNHPSALKLGPDLAWSNMAGESEGDMKRALDRFGGKPWRYVRIDVPETKDRGELQTHLRPTLVVADEGDEEHSLPILGPIVEHRATGTFKLLSYRD